MEKSNSKKKVFVGLSPVGKQKLPTGQAGGRRKVFVGLSGGVDSSVTAALLKQDGYQVTGAFIKVWHPDWLQCDWKEERRDAMRVAATLNIPFVTIDLTDEYKREVADYMIAEYRAGRTPNPDVMCNKVIKFGGFWREAQKQGADFIAAGHYVSKTELRSKNYELRANPTDKDQSYFLWTLTQEQLTHSLFPIANKAKDEVRKLAAKFGLPTASKKESQGLCFLGKLDMKEFLAHYIETKPGKVLNTAGKVVGEHQGALFYTIGERHGFTITEKSTDDEPVYVVAKDIEKNTITVAKRSPEKVLETGVSRVVLEQVNPARSHGALSSGVNWINTIPKSGQKLSGRIRYRQPLQDCTLQISDSKIEVIFDRPQEGVSLGQSVVLYEGEVCLGGGVIVAVSH